MGIWKEVIPYQKINENDKVWKADHHRLSIQSDGEKFLYCL
jgi:hypothetical protein